MFFFLLRGLASVTSLSIYALNLVTGLSIGLSIDWSLLLLSRYREERVSTDDLQLALRRALIPAGRTIFYSALTVAAALATLIVFPLRFLRSMGYGGIIAATVSSRAEYSAYKRRTIEDLPSPTSPSIAVSP